MDKVAYRKLVSGVESNIFKYDHEYANQFMAILKDQKLTEQQKFEIQAEVAAFSIGTIDTTRNRDKERLSRNRDFTEKELTYYTDRAELCSNVIMRQRYLDILWEKSVGGNKGDIGKALVASSIELATLLGHDNQFEKIDSLNRALQVAIFLSKGKSKATDDATNAIRTYIKKSYDNNEVRYTLELIDTVLTSHKLFTRADFEFCHIVCEKGIKHYKEEDDNFTLRGSFVQRLYMLKKLLDPESYDPKAAARDFAQTRIDEAAKRKDSMIVQQHFLIEAEKILKDAALNTEARAVRLQVEALGKSEDYEKEFHHVSYEQEIPKELIEHLRSLLLKYDDTAALLAISPNFMPSWKKAVESEAESTVKSVTDMLVTPTAIDENGMTVGIDTSSPERKGAMRYFQASVEFKTYIAARLLKELTKNRSIKLKNFRHQFQKIKYIDQDCHESIMHGLKLFIRGDYYPASLILTTQFENLIFHMLPTMEIEQYIFEDNGQTQSFKTLTWMLNDIKEFIGEDLYELFYYTLVDRLNLNIRTKIAHGKTTINSQNLMTCVRMIQLFGCLLVCININEGKPGAKA